ncbi:substrate-binding domain-containing protein [Brevibacterium sp. BRM-1]|nr:substrate-binding domain-containing protein [Brevibacterium sp. BRM-1]WAL40020.1 substrate-binding domain-containing protein [Brevibacterium sp. BRM-1]
MSGPVPRRAGPGLALIARTAGVSVSTASRVLRGAPGTSAAARRAVEIALGTLGVQAPGAGALAAPAGPAGSGESGAGAAPALIAVVQNAPEGTEVDAFEALHLALVRRLFDVGRAAVRILTGPGIGSAAQAAARAGVRGAIVLGGGSAGREARALEAAGVPVVRVSNAPHAGARQFVLDSVRGIATALRHLVHLGHRRIGLAVPQDSAADARIAAFRRTLAAEMHIMASRDQAPVAIAAAGVLGGAQAAQELLAKDCSAVVSCAPSITFGILEAAGRAGLRVPEHLSLLTVGEMPDADVLSPPMSQVGFDWEAIAAAAVRELDRVIADPEVGLDYSVAPELVLRASEAPAGSR